ncbi:MAG: hypothetical protein IPF83_04030 [Rhodanobacteraceae bacterium]|nr:hypothetical protein [Rhodanobacteraceae bacterium]
MWCIYPMYDFAHVIPGRAVEGITHSCARFEFEDHRPLLTGASNGLPVWPAACTAPMTGLNVAPTPDRVLASEPGFSGDEQTQAAGTGGRLIGRRL